MLVKMGMISCTCQNSCQGMIKTDVWLSKRYTSSKPTFTAFGLDESHVLRKDSSRGSSCRAYRLGLPNIMIPHESRE